jgi:hypothetical protein
MRFQVKIYDGNLAQETSLSRNWGSGASDRSMGSNNAGPVAICFGLHGSGSQSDAHGKEDGSRAYGGYFTMNKSLYVPPHV